MNFEPSTILVISIVSVATLLRSTFGFADALFPTPLMAMTISTTILLKNWREVKIKSTWPWFISSLAAIPQGKFDRIIHSLLMATGVFLLIQTTQGII